MKKIGIIVAMEEEKEAVLNIMEEKEIKDIYESQFVQGKINNTKCILVRCGVGKVNAARTTQLLIDNFDVDCVINVGSAGAINSFLNIGDVVIGKHVVQHDFDITAFGHSKGYITGIGDYIQCDETLVKKFTETINNFAKRDYNIKLGVVATGDIFCIEPWMKDKINAKFNADVVDMECAAIAQVCYLDSIPFIVIRSVSDTPNKKNASTFEENLELASKRSANILKEVF